MNWFQRLWNNPNLHIVGAMASGAASIAFPAYAPALQVLSGVLGTAAVVLPEQPTHVVVKEEPPVVALPPAAGGGAYHAVDYANLAAALVKQFGSKGRS